MQLRDVLADAAANPLRCALSLFGVAWGMMILLVVIAFGQGLKKQTNRNLESVGQGVTVVRGGTTTLAWRGLPRSRQVQFSATDAADLSYHVAGVDIASPELLGWWTRVQAGRTSETMTARGIGADYASIMKQTPQYGRLLNPIDVERRRRVAVLGERLAARVFGDAKAAVGELLHINGVPFTVIGVNAPKAQTFVYSGRDSESLFVPYTTLLMMRGSEQVEAIVYRPRSTDRSVQTAADVRHFLAARHHFDPKDAAAFTVWDQTEETKEVRRVVTGIQIFLFTVGVLTLVVGAAGVANVMFISVRERIHEIGVRRALGATRREIGRQFFTEALLLVVAGGVIGSLLGAVVITVVGWFPANQNIGRPELSFLWALCAFAVLLLSGVLSALLPARRAANVSPAESLRYG